MDQLIKKNLAYENDFFSIEHCSDCFIPGHLIVLPKEDVLILSEMSVPALQSLGTTLALSHAVIENIIQPARIYTLSFGELMPTIHFHIFPRTDELMKHYYSVHPILHEKYPDQFALQNNPIKQEYIGNQHDNARENISVNGPLLFDWARRKYHNQKGPDHHILIEKINLKFREIA